MARISPLTAAIGGAIVIAGAAAAIAMTDKKTRKRLTKTAGQIMEKGGRAASLLEEKATQTTRTVKRKAKQATRKR